MDNFIAYIDEPVEWQPAGENVRLDITSGATTYRFVMPLPVFFGTFAKAGLFAHDCRNSRDADILPFRRPA